MKNSEQAYFELRIKNEKLKIVGPAISNIIRNSELNGLRRNY